MENDSRHRNDVYSVKVKAGKRRTYFFDVRATRGNDYYLTITESRKRFDDNGYDRHKIFLYKEDFNKFIKALGESIDYVKTDLMPDFDFDAFNHDENPDENGYHNESSTSEENTSSEANVGELEADKSVEVNVEEPTIPEVSEVPMPKDSEEADKW